MTGQAPAPQGDWAAGYSGGRASLPASPWETSWPHLCRDGGHNDAILAIAPVSGRRQLVIGRELERVNDPQDLGKVSPGLNAIFLSVFFDA